MISVIPSILMYIGLVGILILSHYLTFSFPSSIRLIDKPWSLPEEIAISIILAPIILPNIAFSSSLYKRKTY